MPKIVDKEEKRREIALAAMELFGNQGLHKTTIDQVAKAAGIGKGTVYLYFSNKEEIVLEIWESIFQEHEQWLSEVQPTSQNEKQKIVNYFNFSHFEDSVLEKIFNLYSDYLSSVILRNDTVFRDYKNSRHNKEFDLITGYLQEGVKNKEFRQIDIERTAEIMIQLKNGCLTSAAERGLGIAYLKKTIPELVMIFLQTISKH